VPTLHVVLMPTAWHALGLVWLGLAGVMPVARRTAWACTQHPRVAEPPCVTMAYMAPHWCVCVAGTWHVFATFMRDPRPVQVLAKFPVVQHLVFGTLFPCTWTPSTPAPVAGPPPPRFSPVTPVTPAGAAAGAVGVSGCMHPRTSRGVGWLQAVGCLHAVCWCEAFLFSACWDTYGVCVGGGAT
jgi:hypothetical protein